MLRVVGLEAEEVTVAAIDGHRDIVAIELCGWAVIDRNLVVLKVGDGLVEQAAGYDSRGGQIVLEEQVVVPRVLRLEIRISSGGGALLPWC